MKLASPKYMSIEYMGIFDISRHAEGTEREILKRPSVRHF